MLQKKISKLLLLATLTFFSACSEKQSEEYTGTNTVHLESEKDPVLTVGENGKVKIILRTVHRATKDTHIRPAISPLGEGALAEWVKVEEPNIILRKGEREVAFHIVIAPNAMPTKDLNAYELTIGDLAENQMEMKETLRFRLLNVTIPQLTAEQQALINGYKSKGIDLTPILGKVPVKTTVNVPADGLIKGFEEPWQKTYEGFSIITLSEKATSNQPILKMVYNPMGLNEFFYFALKKETIENYEIWYNENSGPLFKEIRDLIKWDDKSVERFGATLDNIQIGEKDKDKYKIEYLGKGKDNYDDEINCIPFSFKYSAWDRQKKLIDEKNLKAIECHTQGASADPSRWINVTEILKDQYNDEAVLPPPTSSWLVKEKKIRFTFRTSVYDAGGYIMVNVEYETK